MRKTMDTQEVQEEIRTIGFEADAAADIQHRIWTFTVSADEAEQSVMTGLEDLSSELSDVIASLENARDALREIASRLETEAAA
jgi:hypothetical protein